MANLVSRVELAAILGITPEYVSKLTTQQNGLPHIGHGKGRKWPVQECIEWYIDHRIQSAIRANQAPSNISEDESRARKTLAEAQLKELELFKLAGTMITVEEAEKEISYQLERVRSKLLNLPSVLAPTIVGIPTIKEASDVLEKFTERLMEDLSNIDVEEDEYEEEVVEEETQQEEEDEV